MASYKDGEVYIPEKDYAPADRERRSFVRNICDDATYPGWFDGLDTETEDHVIDAVLLAFDRGCEE